MTEGEFGSDLMSIVVSVAELVLLRVGYVLTIIEARILSLREQLLVFNIRHGESQLSRRVYITEEHADKGLTVVFSRHDRKEKSISGLSDIRENGAGRDDVHDLATGVLESSLVLGSIINILAPVKVTSITTLR